MATPALLRIKHATVASPDVDAVVALYTKWLGYRAIEKTKVDKAQAASWGAPAMVGRRIVVLQPGSKADVYIRVVEIDPVPNFRPMHTWGWGAIEILADDPVKLNKKLADSPFLTIGKPRFLAGYPTICATQVRGPANEVIYLTADTGPAKGSLLVPAGATVGRPFIMVQASGNASASQDWYAAAFRMKKNPVGAAQVDIIQHAQGLSPDHKFPMGLVALRDHANFIELDGYPSGTGPRPRNHGQLPPGVAMAGFTVTSLDKVKADFLAPPSTLKGVTYADGASAVTVGYGGELIELIEE